MSFVLITPEIQDQIDDLVKRASEHVTPWTVLAPTVVIDSGEKHKLTLAERKAVAPRMKNRHILVGNVECAFTFEEQPAGICRHLSVAVEKKGKLPHPLVVEMICQAFGFTSFPPADGRIWVEEYEPGRHAVNVVEVVKPAAPGTLQ